MRTRKIFVSSRWQGGDNFADNHKNFKWLLKKEGDFFRSCLIFFLRTFETGFRAGFCRFFEENSSAIFR